MSASLMSHSTDTLRRALDRAAHVTKVSAAPRPPEARIPTPAPLLARF